MSKENRLPKIPHAFFKWYCSKEKYEELHGDIEEFYYQRISEVGVAKARLWYCWDVMRCFQSYAWRKPRISKNSNIMMFGNYLKTSRRSLMKNPLTSFINVFGLAVAIGVSMVVYAFISFDSSRDRFHKFKDEVYLTTFYVDKNGTEEQYGTTPLPLGANIRQSLNHIEKVCRIKDANVVVKHEEDVFHERVRLVDPEFLEMFTFPLQWGSATSIADLDNIILSEEAARKYFGDENPVGRDIKVIFSESRSKMFNISGVAKPFPKARIIDFDFLVHFDNLKISNPELNEGDWRSLVNATFIQVKDSANLPLINLGMEEYRALQNEAEPDWGISSFGFVSLNDLHLSSDEIQNDISAGGTDPGRVALPVIASFILALACFNYINIAIVSAARRLKEIGLRKVIGASKRSVIIQFLTENLFITFFAGILGFFLAATVFLPWFSGFSDITSEFNLLDGNMWTFLAIVLLFTGLVSGIYPAFYISKFEVVKIFKGTIQFGKKNTLTKMFLAIQLMLACVGIAFAVMFAQNSGYQGQRSWGYNQKEALYVSISDGDAFEKLKAKLTEEPEVVSVAGSQHHLGKSLTTTVVHLPDRKYEVHELAVDTRYFETMGLSLVFGRFFEQDRESDYKAIVVNELLIKNLSLKQPIGQQIRIDSIIYEVVGVVKDFHFNNFYYENRPTIFTLARPDQYSYLSIKVLDGSQHEAYGTLKSQWSRLFPETPFQGGFQEDVWVGFYEDLATMKKFTRAVALVFVLLAGLGLYGLVKLNISGRVREFSIRKTLGANVKNIAANIFNQYVLLSFVGVILGAPLGHVLNTAMVDMMFPDPRPFGYTGAIISAVILVFVLLAVISTQIRKVYRSNVVDGLKVE